MLVKCRDAYWNSRSARAYSFVWPFKGITSIIIREALPLTLSVRQELEPFISGYNPNVLYSSRTRMLGGISRWTFLSPLPLSLSLFISLSLSLSTSVSRLVQSTLRQVSSPNKTNGGVKKELLRSSSFDFSSSTRQQPLRENWSYLWLSNLGRGVSACVTYKTNAIPGRKVDRAWKDSAPNKGVRRKCRGQRRLSRIRCND